MKQDEITPRERVRLALGRQETDRAPVDFPGYVGDLGGSEELSRAA